MDKLVILYTFMVEYGKYVCTMSLIVGNWFPIIFVIGVVLPGAVVKS